METLRVTPHERDNESQLHVMTTRSHRRVARYHCGSGRIEVEDEHYRDAALEALSPHLPHHLARDTPPTTGGPTIGPAAGPTTGAQSAPAAAGRTAALLARKGVERISAAWKNRGAATVPTATSGGEAEVGHRLNRLSRHDWYVLDSIPLKPATPEGRINHLVVGPRGVFTIHVREYPGARVDVSGDTLAVDGEHTSTIRGCRAEGERVERLLAAARGLPVHVAPVLAIAGAVTLRVSAAPPDVLVVPAGLIDKTLKRRPVVYNPGTVTRIYRLARHERVWLAGS